MFQSYFAGSAVRSHIQKISSHIPKGTTKNGLWFIGGKLVIFALSFAFMTGFANLAPKEVLGTYTYITSILTIISISTLPGMGTAIVRAVARGHEGSLRHMLRLRLKFGLIGSLIAAVIGSVYFAQGNDILGYAFLLGALFVPLTDTIGEMAQYFFQGKKQYGKSMLVGIVCQAAFSLPTLAALFFTDNVLIILGIFWIFQAIGGYVVYAATKISNQDRDFESEKFGFHLTAMVGLRTIAVNIDRVFVWILLGPAAVAIYTIANIPFSKLEQLIPIDALALPHLSNSSLSAELKNKLLTRTGLLLIAIIPIIIIGFFISPFAFSIFFPTFSASVPLFQLLLISLLFAPFLLLKTGLTAWRKQKELYIIETISPVIRIGLFATLGGLFGLLGIVWAIIITRCCESVVTIILFLRTKVNP